MWYVAMNPARRSTPRRPSSVTALAHRVGVEVPHLIVALTTVVAGIVTMIAL
jgi:hypothetical protein